MTNPTRIRFGQIETITIQGDSIVTHAETVHDYATTTQLTAYTSNVFGESDKQVLAEVLKLMDKLKEQDVASVAFDCVKKNNGSKFQMKVCWTVK